MTAEGGENPNVRWLDEPSDQSALPLESRAASYSALWDMLLSPRPELFGPEQDDCDRALVMSERGFFGDGTGAALKRAGGRCEHCGNWRTTTSRMMRADRRWYWVCAECDDPPSNR